MEKDKSVENEKRTGGNRKRSLEKQTQSVEREKSAENESEQELSSEVASDELVAKKENKQAKFAKNALSALAATPPLEAGRKASKDKTNERETDDKAKTGRRALNGLFA